LKQSTCDTFAQPSGDMPILTLNGVMGRFVLQVDKRGRHGGGFGLKRVCRE
jgi:hypothetical protein